MKMYLRGGSGLIDPIDINGVKISPGDLLTTDYGDNANYGIPEASEERKNTAFYLVSQGDGFLFAESVETLTGCPVSGRFYLHDFRFKFCKKII